MYYLRIFPSNDLTWAHHFSQTLNYQKLGRKNIFYNILLVYPSLIFHYPVRQLELKIWHFFFLLIYSEFYLLMYLNNLFQTPNITINYVTSRKHIFYFFSLFSRKIINYKKIFCFLCCKIFIP